MNKWAWRLEAVKPGLLEALPEQTEIGSQGKQLQLSGAEHCVNEAVLLPATWGQIWSHSGLLAKATVCSLNRSVSYLQLGSKSVRVWFHAQWFLKGFFTDFNGIWTELSKCKLHFMFRHWDFKLSNKLFFTGKINWVKYKIQWYRLDHMFQ